MSSSVAGAEIITFLASSKSFVPHLHIPLQSGSNTVLRLMKRRYQRELYVDRVTSIKEVMPNACIGVDVIVGHPGETPELFLETIQMAAWDAKKRIRQVTYQSQSSDHPIIWGMENTHYLKFLIVEVCDR